MFFIFLVWLEYVCVLSRARVCVAVLCCYCRFNSGHRGLFLSTFALDVVLHEWPPLVSLKHTKVAYMKLHKCGRTICSAFIAQAEKSEVVSFHCMLSLVYIRGVEPAWSQRNWLPIQCSACLKWDGFSAHTDCVNSTFHCIIWLPRSIVLKYASVWVEP